MITSVKNFSRVFDHDAFRIRPGLYHPTAEKIMIWPTVFLLIPLIIIWLTGWYGDGVLRQWFILLSTTLFLNSVHHGFAIAFFICVPQVKELVRRKYKHGMISFWSRFSFIYGISFFYVLLVKNILPIKVGYYWYIGSWIVIDYSLAMYHQVAQSKGLNIMYSHQLVANVSSPSDRSMILRISAIERRLYDFIWLCLAVQAGALTLKQDSIFNYAVLPGCLAAVAVVGLSYFTPQVDKTNKLAFSLRSIVYALSMSSWPAHVMARINHGMEYVGIVEKMLACSKDTRRKLWVWMVVLGSIAGFLAFMSIHTGILPILYGFDFEPKTWHLILFAMAFARSISHYYVDRTLFLFRNKENRDVILPILSNKTKTKI